MADNVYPMKGLRALVTGASRGIGLAIAEALAADGVDVCGVARSGAPIIFAEEGAGRAFGEKLDVSDRGACLALVEQLHERWGGLDILVNAAANYQSKSFLETTPEDFASAMNVNLHGAIALMQAVLPEMIDAGFGRIINISSVGGRTASPNQSSYNVSKHALIGLTRCVAMECAKTGVTVNAICPGLVETDMFDELVAGQSAAFGVPEERMRRSILGGQAIGRLLTTAEVASLAVYLAKPLAGGLTGQAILYDGGTLFG